MPRCCNENKSLRLVSNNQESNSENILLTGSNSFAIGRSLELEEAKPTVERSHSRVRCDLSPAPTKANSYIKLISIKVLHKTNFKQ